VARDEHGSGTKASIVWQTGALKGQKYVLDKPQTFIGRDPAQCDIVVEPPTVSRRHAAIEVDASGRVLVADLNSRCGTFVNGEQVTRRELRDGDVVGLGPDSLVTFTYRAPTPVRASGGLAAGAGAAAPPAGTVAEKRGARVDAAAKRIVLPPSHAGARRLRIGRAPDNDIVLDYPGVSRYHAQVDYSDGQPPLLTDLGSTNGTYVNGEVLATPRNVFPADLIFLGGFVLNIDGHQITRHNLAESRITAWQITKEVPGKTLLKEVSLACYPREFIGLLGPSGCGKSTLMDALNGLRPATRGTVYVNDLDLYHNFDALRRSIGYVPQRDILHDALTVERTLYFSAKLRLPEGTPRDQLRRVVDEVIETVGLKEQRKNQFRQLSGGQQKRLSLGIELITKPNFLFLDEPTSPLDPETTESMMLLFRRLADEGRIVVMVTHKFEKFEEMHQVAVLARGGRLAFYGPPRDALRYFECKEPSDIYRRLSAGDPDVLMQEFMNSPHYAKYVRNRVEETRELVRPSGPLQRGAASAAHYGDTGRQPGIRQWITLTRRYLEIKMKDRRNTLILLLQTPIIAFLMGMFIDGLNNATTIFCSALVAIWFGASNSIREIVSEEPIYTRERLVNLKIPSYVFSKFAILSILSLIQCVLFVLILTWFDRLRSEDFPSLLLILYLTSLAGTSLGLFFSALVKSVEKALSMLPLLVIPQLILGGFLKPLANYETTTPRTPPAIQQPQQQPPQKLPQQKGVIVQPQPTTQPPPTSAFNRPEGMGTAGRVAAAFMISRWAFEGLVHAVSLDHEPSRHTLGARTYVAAYENVLEGEPESEVKSAYRTHIALDLGVLALFNVIFIMLTMWALKRKDVL
jgi:ABC transport system ATP-binding/permease protein